MQTSLRRRQRDRVVRRGLAMMIESDFYATDVKHRAFSNATHSLKYVILTPTLTLYRPVASTSPISSSPSATASRRWVSPEAVSPNPSIHQDIHNSPIACSCTDLQL